MWSLLFRIQISILVSYKLTLWFWWWWSSNSKCLKKAILLFSLYLKKDVRDEVDFLHADKHQSFFKLALLFLMERATLVQRTKNRNFVMFFCNILRRKCRNYCVLLWCKTFRYFTGFSNARCYLYCFCLLWLAMEFKSFNFLVWRTSKYTKPTDQNNL